MNFKSGAPADERNEPADFTMIERTILGLTRSINERPALKRASHAFLRTFGAAWVRYGTRNLLHVTGEDVLHTLRPDRGLVVVTNHRSFFDMYVVSSVLLRRCRWIERMYFPVRSNYFYERLDGLLVNAVVAGMSMYPPIFRGARGKSLNRQGVGFLAGELGRAGTVVGLHPEGRRSRGEDPYTLLPAHPGVGEIVHRSGASVLPVFVLGLSNDLARQVRGNLTGAGDPITITFGAPLRLDEYLAASGRARTYLAIADTIREAIMRLGEVDLEVRAGMARS